MKKRIVIFLIVSSIVLLASCGSSGDSAGKSDSESGGKPTLNIGYVNILANAPAIIAEKKGLFEKNLNANIYAFNSGPELYQALAAGDLDVAYAGVPAMASWVTRGLPATIIAKVSDGKIGVIIRNDSSISSISDLKGKVIGTIKKGSGVDTITRKIVLPEGGLTADDVTIRSFKQANIGSALDSKQIAAGIVNEPFVTYAKLRGKKVLTRFRDPGLLIVTTEDALKNKKDAVQTFMKAHKQAIDFLKTNKKESNQILSEAFNISEVGGVSPEQVIAKARETFTYSWKFEPSDFDYYQQLADAVYQLGYIDEPIKDIKKKLFNVDVVKGVVKE